MKLALTGVLIAGLLGTPVSLFAQGWMYFDACGVVSGLTDDWLATPEFGPAPNIKGYLVNPRAVTLIAEARKHKGLACVVLKGTGGNEILVIGTMDEVRRKLNR